MEDKYFDVDEMMVDYAEMTSFDFGSGSFLAAKEEFKPQNYTFKYGNYDVIDMLKSMFSKVAVQKT